MPSTNSNIAYYRYAFMDKPVWKDTQVLDPLSQDLLDIVESITRYKEYIVKADDVFTTLVYQVYGTTSLWWFVLLYNGLYHPLDLQPGMRILFPDKGQLDELKSKVFIPVSKRVFI